MVNEKDSRQTRTYWEDASRELGSINNEMQCLFWLCYRAMVEFHAHAASSASCDTNDPATSAHVRGGPISGGRSRADLDSKT